MKNLKIIVCIVIVYVAGMVTGAALVGKAIHGRLLKLAATPPEKMEELVLQRITRKLDLTDEQLAEAGQIVRRARDRVGPQRRRFQAEIRGAFEDLQRDLREILNEEQERRLEKWQSRIRKHWLPAEI